MEKVLKSNNKEIITTTIETSLANAIRRTVNEIETLAIKEADIFRNDSSFSDENLVHRLGLIPLKNIKLKKGDVVELKLKLESKENNFDVSSSLLGDSVAIGEIPIVRLGEGQGVELVAKASLGKGKDHARHTPGLIYYYHLNKISIKAEAKNNPEPAERYPKVFEFNNELKVKDSWACNFDEEDLNVKGVEISPTNELVFIIENWSGMSSSEIISESVKILKSNLDNLKKILK